MASFFAQQSSLFIPTRVLWATRKIVTTTLDYTRSFTICLRVYRFTKFWSFAISELGLLRGNDNKVNSRRTIFARRKSSAIPANESPCELINPLVNLLSEIG